MKILFCSDGSECSITSFENTAKFIDNAVVDIICVIDWSFIPDTISMDKDSFSYIYDNIADSILNYTSALTKKLGFKVGEQIKVFGSPSESILEVIEDSDYDLIVLGSHGKKGFQKWIGSVSAQVTSRTKIPCFISKKSVNNKKILVTTDGSECSLNYIKKFIELINTNNKEIILLTVKESPEFYPVDEVSDKNWFDEIEKEQRVYASKTLNRAKAIFDSAKIEIKDEVILTGNPSNEIIEYCKKENFDMVVLGSRKKNDISKLLLGSVSKRVIENIQGSALVISCA